MTQPNSSPVSLLPRETSSSENEGALPSFSEIYDSYNVFVRRTLFKLCGEKSLDDLVQETFFRIWRGLEKFEKRSSLKTWIYSIAVRTGFDHLRKSKHKLLFFSSVPEPENSLSFQPQREENQELVRKGLAQLSLEHRTVLVLSVYEGLSIQEMAQVLSTKEGTIKSRLHYAREAMEKYLTEQGVQL